MSVMVVTAYIDERRAFRTFVNVVGDDPLRRARMSST
jgi:hypothetical protein